MHYPQPAHALTFFEFAAQDFPERHFGNGVTAYINVVPYWPESREIDAKVGIGRALRPSLSQNGAGHFRGTPVLATW